jgi:hypothetical protein
MNEQARPVCPLVGVQTAFSFTEVRMPPEILSEMSWSFAGKPPDVPLSSELDVEEWRTGSDDPANRPMFVTLPLLKVGVKSKNGLPWDKPSALRVVQEINTKRPDGNLGHLPKEKRSTDFNLPALRWLGAMLDESTGMVWAKAYVPKSREDVREFLADAKRARARVGTSVYGIQGDKGLTDMALESVDLGHPDRVSHPNAAAVPHITAEMETDSTDPKTGENNPMNENVDSKLVQELIADKVKALTDVSTLATKIGEKDSLIAEMKGKVETLTGVEKLVAEFAGATITEKITKLVSELTDLRKAQQKTQIDGWIAEAVKAVELEELRPTIIAQMGDVDSADKAKARVAELQAREDIKLIAEALVERKAGPRAFIGGQERGKKFDMKDLEKPENIAQARAWAGF